MIDKPYGQRGHTGTVLGGDVEGRVAEGVVGCVEPVGEGFVGGRRRGGEEGLEEVGVVAAGGLEEEFGGGCALMGRC